MLVTMTGLLFLHLVVVDFLERAKARFDGGKNSDVSHYSAQISATDNREGRGAHSHSEDLLQLRPGCLNDGKELLVNIFLHFEKLLSPVLRYSCSRSRCVSCRAPVFVA